jgi:hypothetical protein
MDVNRQEVKEEESASEKTSTLFLTLIKYLDCHLIVISTVSLYSLNSLRDKRGKERQNE